jgi:DNA invertase Pin-like site-specific DNA recombinase
MTGQQIGYKRVSTVDQNTNRQLEGISIDKVFEDKSSGKNTARPQLQAALKFCREGDTLVVHSMDRLARNLTDLRLLVKDLTDRGVAVQFIKESLTFTGEDSPMANLLCPCWVQWPSSNGLLSLSGNAKALRSPKPRGNTRGESLL